MPRYIKPIINTKRKKKKNLTINFALKALDTDTTKLPKPEPSVKKYRRKIIKKNTIELEE